MSVSIQTLALLQTQGKEGRAHKELKNTGFNTSQTFWIMKAKTTNHLTNIPVKQLIMTLLRKTNYCIAKLIMSNINYNKLVPLASQKF